MPFLMAFWLAVAVPAGQTAIWGGNHVRMEVTGSGAELEFDCATGTITDAMPETEGAFSLKGTFTPERGGPTRDGDTSRTVDANYSATIKNDTMTLRVVVGGKDQEAAQYVLVRGREGRLMKCR
jgi:hypothetical protein